MKKIFVVVPAYNVSMFIEEVMRRIPKEIWEKNPHFVIINDYSRDNTIAVINKITRLYKQVHIIDKKKNEGYAKAQKTGFVYALKSGADIVVLLHSDGQYTHEDMPRLLKPLEEERADVVQGSRILGGGALKGRMPLYKYIANRILSKLENVVLGTNISEFHSG